MKNEMKVVGAGFLAGLGLLVLDFVIAKLEKKYNIDVPGLGKE